jgi:hypothetical protein
MKINGNLVNVSFPDLFVHLRKRRREKPDGCPRAKS